MNVLLPILMNIDVPEFIKQNKKMKDKKELKKEQIETFVRFLKERRTYSIWDYERRVFHKRNKESEEEKPKSVNKFLNETPINQWIKGAFLFTETKHDEKFWKKRQRQWETLYTKKKWS